MDVVDLGQALGVIEAVLVGPEVVGDAPQAQLQQIHRGADVIAGVNVTDVMTLTPVWMPS